MQPCPLCQENERMLFRSNEKFTLVFVEEDHLIHYAKRHIEQLVALNDGHEIVCVAGPRHE
jgi:glutaredoxin